VLTAIDFDDKALLQTNEIENKVLKGDLATKLEKRKAAVAEQSPHSCFSVGRFVTHLLCEIADALGDWCGVCGTYPSPVASLREAPPSPTGEEGRSGCGLREITYTRIGIST
jgi:hypothetical protein